MTETITGTNRSAGVSLSELLDADSHPVSDLLRNESRVGVREGNTRVPAWYYTSPEFHALEVEKLWSRVWQLACLEEEIPNVGDYHVYEIADMSFLIVRTADGIKAFRNACLHRGRRLRETQRRGRQELALRLPRVVVESRRVAQGDPVRVGLPERHGRGLLAPRGIGRHVARVRVHQPRPQRWAARRAPRRARRSLRRLPVRTACEGRARREDHAGQLEGVPGSVHGVVPRRGDPPDADGLSRRRQHPIRHLHELLAGDLPAGHREPAPRRDDALRTARRRQAISRAIAIR